MIPTELHASRMSVIKLLTFATLLLCINAKIKIFVTDAPIERIGGRMYKKLLLTDQFHGPKELTYDSSSRNLFFMYMDDELQNSGRAYVNVGTKEVKKIKGIKKNRAVAVDAESGDVYFGSEDGLYKFDPINIEANNIGLYNMNIMKLVVRNNEMYLLDGNIHMIYKVFNQGKTAVKAGNLKTVMTFEVDNNKNVHVVTLCGVYCAYHGYEVIKNKDLSVVYSFLVDGLKTYGRSNNGLYDIDCANGTAKKVADIGFFPNSLTFGDYGDIFYSVDDKIYRLRPISSYVIYNIYKHKKT